MDMPVGFEIGSGILTVRFTGWLTRHQAESAQTETARIVSERGILRVLVDIRSATVSACLIDIFDFVVSAVHLLPRSTKYAVVFSPNTFSPKNAGFAEDVGVNRGLNIKMFTQIDEARKWLLGVDGKTLPVRPSEKRGHTGVQTARKTAVSAR
jgi:hypothetical protein